MRKDLLCEVYCYDEKKVRTTKNEINNIDTENITSLFKVLSDQNRTKLLFALSVNEELCVCDLANIIDSTIANTSHHLRSLYKQGILNFRKEGKLVFYFLTNESIINLLSNATRLERQV